MPIPQLIQRPSALLPGIASGMELRNMVEQNKLAKLAMQREEEAREAMGQAVQGDESALERLMQADPDRGMKVMQYQQMQGQKRLQIDQKEAEEASKMLWYITQAPEQKQQALWNDFLESHLSRTRPDMYQSLKGKPWDKDAALMWMAKSLPYETLQKIVNPKFETVTYRQGDDEVTSQVVNGQLKELGRGPKFAPQKASGAMQKVQDPNSATGWSWQSPSGQRMSNAPPPSGGLQGEISLADGTKIRLGKSDDSQSGLSKSAQNEVEKSLIDAGNTLMSMSEMEKSFLPKWQEGPERAMQWWNDKKSWAGFQLNPGDEQDLSDFTKYRADVGHFYSTKLKEMSGGAVTPGEAERAMSWIPNAGTGVFDGDSPIKLQSKMRRMKEFTQKAVARLNYLRRNGFSVRNGMVVDQSGKQTGPLDQSFPIEKVGDLINKRAGELEAQIKQSNPEAPQEQVTQTVLKRLAQEFGLVY